MHDAIDFPLFFLVVGYALSYFSAVTSLQMIFKYFQAMKNVSQRNSFSYRKNYWNSLKAYFTRKFHERISCALQKLDF